MATDLRDVNRLHSQGVGKQDDGDPTDTGETTLGAKVPGSVIATGRPDNSLRKGFSLDSSTRTGSKRMGSR